MDFLAFIVLSGTSILLVEIFRSNQLRTRLNTLLGSARDTKSLLLDDEAADDKKQTAILNLSGLIASTILWFVSALLAILAPTLVLCVVFPELDELLLSGLSNPIIAVWLTALIIFYNRTKKSTNG